MIDLLPKTPPPARRSASTRLSSRALNLRPSALALAACCSLSSIARAQVPDLIDLSGQYMPNTRLVDPQPAEVQVTSYDVALNVPAPLGERTFLIPGATYHVESASFAEAPPELIQLRAFHAVDLTLLFVQLLPSDWSLSLRVAGGLAGDFEAVDDGLFRFSALGLATHAFSERFVLGGGALASYAFGSLLPLPALYVEYKPIPSISIEAFVPAFIHAKHTAWDRLEIGYRVEIQGNAYAVRDERIADAWPCVASAEPNLGAADPSQCFDHVAYSVITMGPAIAVRLFETVWLTGAVGHSVYRRFEQMNPADEPILGGVQDLPNQFFVRSGLTWRLPHDAR